MTPEMFRKLAALGLSHEQMAGVLEIIEADAEVRKEKARARVQKWREKKKDETLRNVTERNETQRKDLRAGDARVEDNSSTVLPTEEDITSPSARSKRGTRIPEDFQPDIDAAVSEGVPRQQAELMARSFCDYWRSRPGKDGLKLDWPATWRVWYRRDLSKRPTQAQAPPPKPRNAGEFARMRLREMGELPDAADNQARYFDKSERRDNPPGPGIARRIAIAGSG